MRTRKSALARSVVAVGCLFALVAKGQPPQAADLVLRGGAVFTADASNPAATAIAVRGGRIVYVGADAGVAQFVGPATRTLEIGDGMVLPGFHDSHVHVAAGGLGLATCDLSRDENADAVLAQTGRRTTVLDMRPFTVTAEAGRREWRQMLLAIEERLILADATPGMLADQLSDYLYARSTGHIGSLMTLITRGCQRAVRTGAERLDQKLLDQVKNDAAADKARHELDAAFTAQRLTTAVGRRR